MSAVARIDDDVNAAIARLDIAFSSGNDAAARSLDHYLALMLKWNRVYNLTAITERSQMVTRHLLDSLSIVAPLDALVDRRPPPQANPRILDVGTGAGLPGIPLAIARPDWQLTLIDAVSKKTAFVTQAVAELALKNVQVMTGRVEKEGAGLYDVIVSRAFASLADFAEHTRPLLALNGFWAAMKASIPYDELKALPPDVECDATIPLQVPGLDALRHLIILRVRR